MRLRLTRWVSGSAGIVLGTVVVGATLRVLAATWGLPYELHSDEWVIVTGAVDLAQRNSFEPSIFLRPDHVEIKLSNLVYLAYAAGVLRTSVEAAYAADPGTFIFLARLVTVAFGTLMIPLAYLIGRRFARPVGVIAAVLVAFFPPFILHSGLATPDVPLAAMTMVLILACMHYVTSPGLVSLLVASAAVSVSIAIKYPGALSASMIAVVVVVAAARDRRWTRVFSHGAIAVGAVLVFLFMISPVLFTNISGVIESISKESRSGHAGADGLGWGGNLVFYTEQFLLASGILLALLALAGVVYSIRHRALQAIPLALGFVTWIILSALALHWERWAVSMYLSPLMFAAIGAYFGYRYVGQIRPAWRWRRPVAATIASIVALNLLVGSAATTVRLTSDDSRTALMDDLAELGVTSENSIYDGYSPLATWSPYMIVDKLAFEGDALVPLDTSKEYVVLSSCNNARFYTAEKYSAEREIYAAVRSQFDPVLVVESVVPQRRSPWEVLSIVDGVREIREVQQGGLSGCDISVYRIPR